MSNQADAGLADAMKQGGQEAKKTAAAAIKGLADAADWLSMRETAAKLRETEEKLASDTFRLIVMGRFKNGKSTLLNALMGGTTKPVELNGHKGPMVVDDLPATAALTGVHYANEPYIKVWYFDGKSQTWTLDRYLEDSTLGIDEEESQRRFQDIREFEMGYPARLCQAGVVVYDSPGLDEHHTRTKVTKDATRLCDAAVVVYRSDQLMGQSELMDASALVAEGTRTFTLINLWGSRKLDDRLRGYVWNRYVRDHLGGPAWSGQDLSSRDIYFVNAEFARDGRYDGDPAQVAASGLAEFEGRLADFLLRERQEAHLSKHVTAADSLAATVEIYLDQRRKATQLDQTKLREAYTQILPRLEAVRNRPARLPAIFQRYQEEAEAELTAGFTELIAQIRRELPDHLAAVTLPSAAKATKVFQQKKLQAEAAQAVSDFVASRIDQWSEQEANAILAPILERLGNEVENEVAAVSRQLAEIHVDLGWSGPGTAAAVVSTSERVASAVASFLVGDIVGVLTGGAGGWRGAAGSLAGGFGAAFLMGAVGLASAAIFWPVVLGGMVVFGVLGGGAGLEGRVKKKMAEQAVGLLGGLPAEVRPKLTEKVSTTFTGLENVVSKEIRDVIDEEERHIRETVELNQREQGERDAVLAELEAARAAVAGHRVAVQRALTIARQAL